MLRILIVGLLALGGSRALAAQIVPITSCAGIALTNRQVGVLQNDLDCTVGACVDAPAVTCHVDADCPSGQCAGPAVANVARGAKLDLNGHTVVGGAFPVSQLGYPAFGNVGILTTGPATIYGPGHLAGFDGAGGSIQERSSTQPGRLYIHDLDIDSGPTGYAVFSTLRVLAKNVAIVNGNGFATAGTASLKNVTITNCLLGVTTGSLIGVNLVIHGCGLGIGMNGLIRLRLSNITGNGTVDVDHPFGSDIVTSIKPKLAATTCNASFQACGGNPTIPCAPSWGVCLHDQ